MPRPSWTAAHLLILVAEVAIAVALAISLAFLGAEDAQLTKQRGADLRERNDLSYRLQQVQTELEWAGRRLRVEAAIERLDLPLEPPVVVAAEHQSLNQFEQ